VLDTPVKGWLAGIPAGACDIANAIFQVGCDPTANQAAIIGLFAPVGLVIGAFYGPFAALPAEIVERDEKVLRDVLTRARSGFATRLETQARKACSSRIVQEDEDAILIVGSATVSLKGPEFLDPSVTPRLRMSVRLIRTDGKVLYDAEFRHTGRRRAFTGWASSPNDLRDHLDQALDKLAERIVDEVFLTLLPPE
jgi:hypothetical protein